MLDGRFRSEIERWVRPVGMSVKRAGIPADAITAVGLAMSVACAIAVGAGALRLGVILLILTGVPDTLDGAVAKASGTSSQRGAFFDSVSDRVTDALLFGGVAFYLASRTAQSRYLPVLAFAAFATAVFPSYIRAKADALGLDAKGGLVERAERFVILGLGLLFDQFLVASLVVLIVLNLATAVQRFAKVWRTADKPQKIVRTPSARRRPRTSGESLAAERWRARRAEFRERSKARREP
jgi:CDP-diacylglycerol--glycerol-3-phosphate 3-phosphatidyltransferase